jgi:hypothetical protein
MSNVSSDVMWTLDSLTPMMAENPYLSSSQLSLILLVDMVLEREMDVIPILPKLLHVTFLYLDHSVPLIFLHAKQLLANVIYRLSEKLKTGTTFENNISKVR